MLLTGFWVIPAGLPFLLVFTRSDEIQIGMMLRATAGDTDVSRRFLCLLSSTFSFSFGLPLLFLLFWSPPFSLQGMHAEQEFQAGARLGQLGSFHQQSRGEDYTPGRTPAAPTNLHRNTSLHPVLAIFLPSCSGCVCPRALHLRALVKRMALCSLFLIHFSILHVF